jgi:Flp pilus assembly pilin Flp
MWFQDIRNQQEDGQGLTEYAMIISFVVILLVILLYYFGDRVEATYQDILDELPF